MNILTIAIPTFDRNERLLQILELLLPQITPECRLLILDNHSPTPVENTVRPLLETYGNVDSEIIRHPYNLGGHCNFLRCFELCASEYLWMLGDDDPPKPDAVQIILNHIREHPNVLYFNFSGAYHHCRRACTVTTRGLTGLSEHFHEIGLMIWISVSIYRCAPLREELRFSSSYLQGICPQLLPVLRAARSDGECHLSVVELVDYTPEATLEGYSAIAVALASMMILDLPWPDTIRRRFARGIRTSFNLTPKMLTRALYLVGAKNADWESSLYWFDQIHSRLFYFDSNLISVLWRACLRFFLAHPRLAKLLVDLRRFVKGPPPHVDPILDVFNRA
jgi:glycosyltransferase involved in cell wall biosynthesis